MRIVSCGPDARIEPTVDEAVTVLADGGTVVLPTDTQYALACNGLDTAALARVFDLKRRNYTKAVPLFVRDVRWARELGRFDARSERLAVQLWPGALTLVVARTGMVPAMAAGGGATIGLRAPDHPFTQLTLERFGYPLCGTSANASGRMPARDPAEIVAQLARTTLAPDLVIDAGVLPESEPSTVVDLSGAMPRIVRQGAIRADTILPLL
jgi:L-threonylcarbamoyladenylate synthase